MRLACGGNRPHHGCWLGRKAFDAMTASTQITICRTSDTGATTTGKDAGGSDQQSLRAMGSTEHNGRQPRSAADNRTWEKG